MIELNYKVGRNMKLNEKRIVNDIRLLALDMINAAGSGHPGIALDAAPTLYTLFAYHLKFDLERKAWCNRDRFVLSAGHGSALLYSTLYYLLDEFNLEELKNFRKINSQCTGHPEYNLNNRIEVTTGPLGEGFATSVGLAIGEKYLESTFNKKKNIVFDYKIYTLVSDGDLMEGISYEAASLAGNLGLDNLIVLYDSNGVTADGDLDKAMYENIPDRFASMNWEVIKVKDGENIGEISNAIEKAKKSKKPVLIEIKTTLGIYSKYEGTNRIHSNLDKDFLVYTAAIKEDNVEMIEAKKKKIPMMERGEFLGEITKLYSNTIGIAGTHGKTSTTSMVSLIFLEAGRDPTIQVGSILSNINGNYRVGKSDTLIIEACEYCDSFLSFKQKSAIILNIDNDHLDYFKNLENIKKSFNKYVSHLPNDGYLVINNDDKNSSELKDNTSAKVVTYGINNDSDYMATDIDYDAEGCARFNVINYGNNLGRIELSVPGEHNVLNALSAIALASSYDISFEDIKKGIKKYKGASRRLEYKGKFKGACVYDDYGHHPTEIMATSNAIHKKQYNESWVIFEAHTYSRAYKHKVDFAKALKNFDHIIVTDIYAAREENVYGITEDDIVKAIKKYGKEAFYISNYDDIKLYLSQYVHDGDLILTLGAGNVTKVADLLVSKNE